MATGITASRRLRNGDISVTGLLINIVIGMVAFLVAVTLYRYRVLYL
jgi:hypothetical protein